MALSSDLTQFLSSGVYRLEFDKSQTANVPSSQLRLVVGYSKKGPFNTPVFISDPGFFEQVYGPIDRTQERKGSFFHRTAAACLERGPIIALNLLRLNNDENSGKADLVEYQVFSTSVSEANKDEKTELYSGFYNKDRFWFPEDKSFLQAIGANKGIFQLVNLKQNPITVLVRQAAETRGFDITAKSWFGVGSVPSFMHDDDYISDYLIDVFVIDGDFTNYQKLAIDPIFGKYFDSTKGLIKSKLSDFVNAREVNLLATYSGTLIPDFVDLNGNNMFIQDKINSDSAVTGLFCAVDKTLFDDEVLSGSATGIDIIGHNIEHKTNTDVGFNKINFLSYDRVIKDDLSYEEYESPEIPMSVNTGEDISFYLTSAPGNQSQVPPIVSPSDAAAVNSGTVNYVIKIGVDTHTQFNSNLAGKLFLNTPGTLSRTVGSYVLVTNGIIEKWAPVVSLAQGSGSMSIGISIEESGYSIYLDGSNNIYFLSVPDWMKYDAINSNFISAQYNGTYDDFINGTITSGDKVHDSTELLEWYLEILQYNYGLVVGEGILSDNASGVGAGSAIMGTAYGIPSATINAFLDTDLSLPALLPAPGPGAYLLSDGVTVSDNFTVLSLAGQLNMTMTINTAVTLPANEVIVLAAPYKASVFPGDYLVADELGPNGESRLTKIERIVTEGSNLHIYTVSAIKKTTLPSTDQTVERYRKIESIIEHYKLFAMNGFTSDPLYHSPNGTQERIDLIYADTLSASTNLFKTLIDKEAISYRYIVDTFGLGIQPESKNQLTTLAKSRQNAFAILSGPSMQNFKESTDPRFTDINGSVSSEFIASGGDLSKNPTNIYSLPSISSGANFGGFYIPYIAVRDRGKNISVPPAGYVSNNFLDKYSSSLPWSIVAGPRRGIISGTGVVGLETNFSKDDRDYLEPFGLNPIIFQRGVGLMIAANKTAQQNVKSALSSIHVREVLIYIQDGIAEILKTYQWEFNTAQTRLEISTLADAFMAKVQKDNGVYDYKNVMDQSNNDSDVINANIGVLDTFIEPVKGLEILVHRTTILKTGAISTGQFK